MSTGPADGRPAIPDEIADSRLVAIGRGLDADSIVEVAEGLVAGGVRAFEITLNSPAALDSISALARRMDSDRLLIGAGTVLTIEQARAALDAGARFIVAPVTEVVLITWCAERNVPAFPGAFTATEIRSAWDAGAAAVKLFPASSVGPAYVRELRGPFPEIPLVPTGGVSVETAPAFVAAGAVAVAIGSWLTGGGDAAVIGERARQLITAVAR